MLLTKDKNLEFLQKKVQEIKVAMFRPEMNSVIQLPNNIISTTKTDNDGHIWFYTSCNRFHPKNIDGHFNANLEYYKKGANCHLRITGTASVAESYYQFHTTSIEEKLILIKFKIMQAEYYENWALTASLKEKALHFFSELLMPGGHRHFDFSEA